MNVIIFRRTLQLVQHARTRLELDIEESSAPYWLCIHEKHSNSRSLAGKADLIFMGIIHHDNKSDQLKYSKLKKKYFLVFPNLIVSFKQMKYWQCKSSYSKEPLYFSVCVFTIVVFSKMPRKWKTKTKHYGHGLW